MLPITPEHKENEEIRGPDLTFKISSGRLEGKIDGINAVKQAVYVILSTEQGAFKIYDPKYGIKTVDLIGKEFNYASSEMQSRIKESLLYDDRIIDVINFNVTKEKNSMKIAFEVLSIYGSFTSETRFDRNV